MDTKKDYPKLEPIINMPGEIIAEVAEYLDVSRSLLYLVVKKGHEPSPRSKERMCRNAALPLEIWELPRYETVSRLYEAFRTDRDTGRTEESREQDEERAEEERISELAELL